jgi:hypothetical protein
MSYLSNPDQWKFRKLARERLGHFNCITKGGAVYVAFDLRSERIQIAIAILQIINCRELIDSLLGMYPEKPADPTIVATICEEINFRICQPQTSEFACRYFPSRDTITMSLIHHEA